MTTREKRGATARTTGATTPPSTRAAKPSRLSTGAQQCVQRRAIVVLPVEHDTTDSAGHSNVLERIATQQDDIRPLARGDAAPVGCPEELGRSERRSPKCLGGRES